ncbi:Putative alpha/beta hydrolase-1 [Septoria linicola]|uniref:Alpha/beta hydrolase-1 n=1 Tax=Septoria linicola TaxID=215465 RepID=A0A9Q9AJW6_9PEZI|nr:putative alpha/beta hydrolase-1 [Septoria linicola]USW47785.1 Putative alpha/beta hydrolase-1 [Septoria linicola]
MSTASRALSKLGLGLTAVVGVYAVLLGVLLTPRMQRFALYANKFNTLKWRDVHDGTPHGFASNQVTPFNLSTADGETLYAWHILPLDQYARHEKAIRAEQRPLDGPVPDFTQTTAFKVLRSNQPTPARVVVSFHGNAGHIAQGCRPATNRFMATQPNTHVFTIDYRGFGHSTGHPTEAGLILDGVSLVNYIVAVTQVPPERVVILGQSLGTAVSAAVALYFADPSSDLIPHAVREAQPEPGTASPTTFAGVVLAAPFNSIPTLLLTYRIGGLLPLLLPLRPLPFAARLLTAKVTDKWPTAERLRAYYYALESSPSLRNDARALGSVQLIHALNDADIPYHQTEMICRRILDKRDSKSALQDDEFEPRELIVGDKGAAALNVKREGFPTLRFELVEHGGHNHIITYSPVALAVIKAFENLLD